MEAASVASVASLAILDVSLHDLRSLKGAPEVCNRYITGIIFLLDGLKFVSAGRAKAICDYFG